MNTLSNNAVKLLAFLKESGGAWEGNCMDHVFNKPAYIKDNAEAQTAYWQWEINAYNYSQSRPVLGVSVEFTPTVELSYSRQLSAAYQELRAAGLASERNSGYNDYWFFAL